MAKELYSATIVPGIASLKTNVRRIPYFHVLSGVPRDGGLFESVDSGLEIEFVVKSIRSPLKKSNGKVYTAAGNNTLYFEYPIGFGIVPRMIIEFGGDGLKAVVNRAYYRLGHVNINQLYSPGWHLIDSLHVKLLDIGFSLLHGAAFVYRGKTVFLIALSDTGKTRTTLTFISRYGADYIGEDILATDGDSLFACPFAVSHLHADLLKLDASWGIYEKLYARLPGLDILGRKPIRSILDVLGRERVCLKSPVDYIFVIRKGEKAVSHLNPNAAGSMILASNRAEFRYSTNPMLISAHMMGLVDIFGAMEKEKSIIDRLINKSRLYSLSGDTDFFVEAIRDIVSSQDKQGC